MTKRSPLRFAILVIVFGACSAQAVTPSADAGARADLTTPSMDVGPQPDRATPPADTGPTVDRGRPPTPSEPAPPFDAATLARVRELRARGATRGNRLDVFAKIGDSITESQSFLSDIGNGWYELGANASLEATIRFFNARAVGDGRNSFNRVSACATPGWTAGDALNGTASPLQQELAATRPGYAIVMYGTNDIDRGDLATWRTNMNRVLDVIEQNGTVPVISTIPDRLDEPRPGALVASWNDAVRQIAAARHIPLVDYWVALQPLPRKGLSPDGIHPSVYAVGDDPRSATLTPEGLRFGYNMRNLVTLRVLDRLRLAQ